MRLIIFELTHRNTILSGAFGGRQLLSTLISSTPASETPEVIFLDFTGIEVATSSFLRESLIGFRDFCRNSMQTLYPVLANASGHVIEELEFYLRQTSDTMWQCRLDSEGGVTASSLIGELEPAQRETFEIIRDFHPMSAPQLVAKLSDRNIGVTAWNNRLSSLSSRGLLIERREGKTKTFSPVLENV